MAYETNSDTKKWAKKVWEKLQVKLKAECERIGGMIPGDAEDGKFPDMGSMDIFWWTNGFWSGMLWQMYHATGVECYKDAAVETEQKLDEALRQFSGLHHDTGFMWLHSAVANYRLTGSEEALRRGLHAANILAGRYNPNGHFIRAWNEECDPTLDTLGIMIVDSMMNIPLLYWASEVSGDVRFTSIAMEHADTVLKYIIRQDGSCNHIVDIDPQTGDLRGAMGGQGYEEGSSWSRGQSWALYGMVLSYCYTGKERYLNAAKCVAHYFIANVAMNNYIPLCDFRAPKEPLLLDTSAGMVAVCGLLEIAKHVGVYEQGLYEESAVRMLKEMVEHYCDWAPERDGILGYGTVAYSRGHHRNIIYADYFLVEAVLRLLEKDFLIW